MSQAAVGSKFHCIPVSKWLTMLCDEPRFVYFIFPNWSEQMVRFELVGHVLVIGKSHTHTTSVELVNEHQ